MNLTKIRDEKLKKELEEFYREKGIGYIELKDAQNSYKCAKDKALAEQDNI